MSYVTVVFKTGYFRSQSIFSPKFSKGNTMKNVYKDPIETIHQAIRAGDYDALSDALDLAYNSGGRSAIVKSAICFGYRVLADVYGQSNPVEALLAHDRSRQMFPGDKELLQDEIDFLIEFVESNDDELGEKDYDLIGKMAELIKIKVPKSSKEMADRVCDPLVSEIKHFETKAELKETINIYRVSEPMLYNLFADFTDEERKELLNRKIAQTIIEIEKSEKKKREEEKLNKANSNSKP